MRKDIQGLRAVAVLMVVAYHAGSWLPTGYTGVDVFFVISGFVITNMLWRERERAGRVSLRRFYARRVRRLFPAAALTLFGVGVLSFLLQSPFGAQQTTARTGAAAAVLGANAQLAGVDVGYFDAPAATNPLLHMWSLSVEEQFYVLFPILLLGLWALSRGARAVAAIGVAVVTTASLVLTWSTHHDHETFAFYSPFTRVWEFGAGTLLALLVLRARPLAPHQGVLALVGGGALIVAGATGEGVGRLPGPPLLAPVVGAVLVLLAGTGTRWADVSPLALRPMVWLGDRSYSWYLWHWPCIVLAELTFPRTEWATTAGAAIALVLAMLSFRLVEQPLRRNDRIVGRRALGLAAGCAVLGLVANTTLAVGADRRWGSDTLDAMATAVTPLHQDAVRLCDEAERGGGPRPTACSFDKGLDGAPVYLVGDSTAGQFTEGVTAAASRLGRPTEVVTRAGCMFLDTELVFYGTPQVGCREYVQRTTKWLVAQPPGTVVLASLTNVYALVGIDVRDPVTKEISGEQARKAALWTDGLARTMRRLRDAGHRVLHVHLVPQFHGWRPAACSLLRALRSRCGASLSRADVDAFLGDAYRIEAEAARRAGGRTVDLRESLCPDGECRTNIGDRWLYRDELHLTVDASRHLEDVFVEHLRG